MCWIVRTFRDLSVRCDYLLLAVNCGLYSGELCGMVGLSGRERAPAMVWEDLRTAVRFPMHLPVLLMVAGEQIEAVTVNISHNGVLLQTDQPIDVMTPLEFLLTVPAEVMQNEESAAIHCAGRVIRSYKESGASFIAAVIDDYRFQ